MLTIYGTNRNESDILVNFFLHNSIKFINLHYQFVKKKYTKVYKRHFLLVIKKERKGKDKNKEGKKGKKKEREMGRMIENLVAI